MVDRITVVETARRGTVRFYDAVPEVDFRASKQLDIVSIAQDETIARFAPGEWVRVSVLGQNDKLLYSIDVGTPMHVVMLPEPFWYPQGLPA